ncbi:hypothetical protein [Actinoplanes lobatus]|uniref:Formylmethanofuran dehydrogenase subunit D n=2 Tax=Actinoplanes lobatus TaxID=113568 RepID=A0A7W7HLG7_9ACTN|nr:hypothetical protein [Actinoplanes lobatus]MBB4752681.1 formylmethanofuran dehydrogenase subunit D [Actinoplanes lobatus]
MTLPRFRISGMRAMAAAALAAGTLTAGLPTVASADPGDYTTKVIVKNRTGQVLVLTHSQVTDGEWILYPPETIASNGIGRMSTASGEDEGGTGGTVTYETDYGDVVIYWNDPDTSDENDFTCDAPDEFTCSTIGSPKGQHPVLNVDIFD